MSSNEFKANIFDIQRGSLVDGPGVRTTVFFYRCNLRCQWCHNPEGMGLEDAKPNTHFELREYNVDELVKTVAEDIPFYVDGGGVTCSGGECMLQSDFLLEFFKRCKKVGIHTAVDTAGNVPFEKFADILPYTDLFLYDVKCISADLHKKFTGVGNELILSNLKNLFLSDADVIIRVPLIPGFNDNDEEMLKIKEFISGFKPKSIELLPFHTLGYGKYEKLGLKHKEFNVPNEDTVMHFKRVLGVVK